MGKIKKQKGLFMYYKVVLICLKRCVILNPGLPIVLNVPVHVRGDLLSGRAIMASLIT